MITSFTRARSFSIALGSSGSVSGSAGCACNEYFQGNYNTYYVTTYHDSNDLRYITGIFVDSELTQEAPSYFYYATALTEEQFSGGGSQYWSVLWAGPAAGEPFSFNITISEVLHHLQREPHGVYRDSAGNGNCSNLTWTTIYTVPGETFENADFISLDPFNCSFPSWGTVYVHPIHNNGDNKLRRIYYNYLYDSGSWSPGTLVWYTGKFGVSANSAVCNPTTVAIRHYCQSVSGGSTFVNFAHPIMSHQYYSNIESYDFAPSGYYRSSSDPTSAKYWNGTTGQWTSQEITIGFCM